MDRSSDRSSIPVEREMIAPSKGLPSAGGNGADREYKDGAWLLDCLNDVVTQSWRSWSAVLDMKGTTTEPRVSPPEPAPVNDISERPRGPTSFDRLFHALLGQVTLGLSPAAFWLAYGDWVIHLLLAPGKRMELAGEAVQKYIKYVNYVSHLMADQGAPMCTVPLNQDYRFRSAAWHHFPFNAIHQAFLLNQQWWKSATTGISGVSPHHEAVVSFMTRQLLDTVSPVNFVATNPEVLETTLHEGGRNLIRGAGNLWEDWERAVAGRPPVGAVYRPGMEVAVSRGEVVYRNRLIELIQYSPTTADVVAEPLLIVPAWIMKYYILDLSPSNSLVKYLVSKGHTVFMISWHNPTTEDRDLGLGDYLRMGVLDALKAVSAIVPGRKIDAAGYCLGGTLLAIAAAYLAREKKDVLNTVTFLAAQIDFTEAGELTLFIDDSQLNYLEDIMWDQGYLDTKQMAGAFQLLRSYDLIWSRMVHEYLMGRRMPMNDLMAWNADSTRMPFRMHSEYLRRLFLANDLFEGRLKIEGRPVFLGDISVPMFAVATEHDHIAPWRSVYKLNLINDSDVTFVLTSGGHNAGIVSEPVHTGRHFRISRRAPQDHYLDPETWLARTGAQDGSWWPAWVSWLDAHSHERATPPSLGAPDMGYPLLEPAPGRYVHEH